MEFLVIPQFTHSLVECFSASEDGCTFDCIGMDCEFKCDCFDGGINTYNPCTCNGNNPCTCNGNHPCPCNGTYTCVAKGCVRDYTINGVG